MITDLTKGTPSRVLLKFALPLLGSAVFQQLYNICDSIIAGRFAGEDALAAIGVSHPITSIFIAVAMGCNIGCSVVISRLFGGKRMTDMKTAVNTSCVIGAVTSALLLIVGIFLCEPMLSLLNTPENIFDSGAAYLDIYIYGLPFLIFYNIISGIFTALGDAKTPMYLLICSSIINVVLDLLFVAEFHWGVEGAAWATFIAQGVSAVLSLIILPLRIRKVESDAKPRMFDKPIFKSIMAVTVPSVIQQSFVSLGALFIQGLVNGFGSTVVAGFSSAIKLNTFAIMAFVAVCNAMSSYTAQNIGAGEYERVKKGFSSGIKIALGLALPFAVAFFFFGEFFLGLFIEKGAGEEVISTGMELLRINAPFYFVICIKIVIDGILRGGGNMKAYTISTFTDLILRVILAYALAPTFGVGGIWVSWPIGWCIATGVSLLFYRSTIKKICSE